MNPTGKRNSTRTWQLRALRRPRLADRLDRSFYDRPTERVARQLLGKALLRRIDGGWIGGIIVETEAYLSHDDPACHAHRGQTRSNASMFGPPGTLYVYPIHAKYCMNAVTESTGMGSAVLIRAIEPVWGVELMRIHRGYDDPRRLTRGPAMLCQALKIDRGCDGLDLTRTRPVTIAEMPGEQNLEIATMPRIGISQATDALLRFVVAESRFASRPVNRRPDSIAGPHT